MKKQLQVSTKPAASTARAKTVQNSSKALEWRKFLEMPETLDLVVSALRQRLGLDASIRPIEAF